MTENQHEDLSAEEQELLESWSAPEPPPDFVERVMTQVESRPAPSERRKWIAVAAGIAIVAGAGWLASLRQRVATSGQHEARERTTLALGDRAVVVSEAMTSLAWTVQNDGSARVEQSKGNAFYRVDRSERPFVVHTPGGTVRVIGTCFRVEVKMKEGVKGAALGAAVATAVIVTVYEGRVVTASTKGETILNAGETRALPVPEVPPATRAVVLKDKASGAPVDALKEPNDKKNPAALSHAELTETHAALQEETDALREEVQTLRGQLASAEKTKQQHRTYDIDQAELLRMAERCELRWDIPSLGVEPPRLSNKWTDALELSQAERSVIDEAFRASHDGLVQEIRRAYVEITGDDATSSLATGAMLEEIHDKVSKAEVKRVYQVLARERAGMQPPPVEPDKSAPFERLYRLMTRGGDDLEQSIANELGEEMARKVRDHKGGWHSRSRSSHGCPKP